MTTAHDLFTLALEPRPERSVGQGDLSLSLAGAELVDLLQAGAVDLDGDLIVPGPRPDLDDLLLRAAASALVRTVPYENVEDWLWRRGRDLAAAYQAAFEEAGLLTRPRRGLLGFGADHRMELVDTPARRRAQSRRQEGEPVLGALAAAIGIRDGGGPQDDAGPDGEAVATVLAAVHDAVTELEAVRQRRSIENTAFANVWRVP
ncbi:MULTISPECIES: GPP34 family phosphoprotein [Streptomyces]|uniref:GPP34 family phosphoprotein n=1 Tax=Streptomyces TaxID=1883 RepID=UPI0009909C1A|nr:MULTISPECIES: GPP34 family phosphoprotein [unclassified Streptomyces]AQT70472.1 GPP34 family phosphoprotein [Streptomyces sp. fd1-xmd]MDX6761893.1 GPP34 family phosphoprotein [Streptomyces sp. F8]